ncbi:MAG: hypothetical protein ACHQ49_12195 [Elusimicrobiota bacterium]
MLGRLITILVAAAAILAGLVCIDMADPLLHPLALKFGEPATAVVGRKWTSTGRRTAGNYMEFNYQYAGDDAPRIERTVNPATFAALAEGSHVQIHFIPGCPACFTLDYDYDSSLQQGLVEGLVLLGVAVLSLLRAAARR